LRILGAEAGLPRLSDLEFAIYEKARPDKAAAALAEKLLRGCRGPDRAEAGDAYQSDSGAGANPNAR
jgi:hypothetical protein